MRSIRTMAARIALAALTATAVLAATGAGAHAALTRPDTSQPGTTAAATTTSSLVATLSPAHPLSATTGLVLYGAYTFDPFISAVTFNQHVMPASIPQLVEPYIRVPDANPHTYLLRFHLTTNGTTTTRYQLSDQHGYQTTQTANDGSTTVDFTITVQFPGATWEPLTLTNLSGDIWVFYSCEIDEQIG
jgi:hypothetical protein